MTTPKGSRHPAQDRPSLRGPADDTEGVEDISPGLPARRAVAQRRRESARATPGYKAIQPITFERSEASAASISALQRSAFGVQCSMFSRSAFIGCWLFDVGCFLAL